MGDHLLPKLSVGATRFASRPMATARKMLPRAWVAIGAVVAGLLPLPWSWVRRTCAPSDGLPRGPALAPSVEVQAARRAMARIDGMAGTVCFQSRLNPIEWKVIH